MMAERGLKLDHSTIACWVLLYAPVLNERIRLEMRRPNRSWRVAKTYVRVAGTSTYLYRAIDSAGNTIDFLLSPKRDLTAAKAFLQSAALQVYARRPRVINVDGHPAYPGAIEGLKQSGKVGRNCRCRRASYLNNILEQDHRFVKQRMISSQWFRSVDGALRIIAGYEAVSIVRKGQIRRLPTADFLARRSSPIARSVSQPDLNRAMRSLPASSIRTLFTTLPVRAALRSESFSAEDCALVYQYPIDSFVQQRATRWTLTLASQLIIRIYL
jgi:IS6 family transposase